MSQGKVWHGEISSKSKTGELYWYNISVIPFIGESGPERYIFIRTDITLRKNNEVMLKLQEERLDMALKGANAGLWDWSVNSGEFITGDIWSSLLGYTTEELDKNMEKD